jgi:hypothetical protein
MRHDRDESPGEIRPRFYTATIALLIAALTDTVVCKKHQSAAALAAAQKIDSASIMQEAMLWHDVATALLVLAIVTWLIATLRGEKAASARALILLMVIGYVVLQGVRF